MAMYGKRRVVLSTKPTRSGRYIVSVSGGKSHIPLGFWSYDYRGRFYADLKTADQLYRLTANADIAHRVGVFPSKAALRDAIMTYFNTIHA